MFSCKKNNENDVYKKIYSLHQKIDTISKDSMKFYLKNAKELFSKKGIYPDSLKAENNFLIGKHFDKSNNLDSTIFYYNKAIDYDTDNIISDREFDYYYQLILKYYYDNNLINAINYADKLILNLDTIEYRKLGLVYNKKTMIYIKLKEYKNALNNNYKSADYYSKANNINALNTVINTRSRIYYEGFKKKDSAKIILKNLLVNEKKLSNNNKYQSYIRLGIYYFYDNKFIAAKNSYQNALRSVKISNSNFKTDHLANCYNNIAEVYLKLKNYRLTSKYLDSTFLLGISNLREYRIRNAQKYKLQLLYETKNSVQPILNYLDTIQNVNERNYKKQMDNEFLALTKSIKKEQLVLKQKQESELNNSRLKKKQLFLSFVLSLLIMSTFAGVIYYRKKKLQHNRDEILIQQRLFRAQMSPHFTSNILYSIQNLFKTDIGIANDYLIKFSRLLRLNLENSIENYVSINKEIEAVEKYLELQNLRFPNVFSYKITGDCINDELLLCIPPMLIQPFVENAIEHAFKDINYKGIIEINLNFKDKLIFCEILDNGIGISAKKNSTNKQSTSTKLIKQLIKKLTKKDVLVINTKNSMNKKGTCVQFYIPYKKD